ncbi:hypothetical protein GCM10020295_81070 [Streptomyces cinereospinus]
MSGGPLAGLRIVEIAGIGPAPYGCMMLADLGADVILVERPAAADQLHAAAHTVLFRNRRRTAVDLKTPEGVTAVLDLVADADVLVEGFRPGVTERLGIGPGPCLRRNPRLVYARMTGWGQYGPLAHTAGHDLNYIARSGALAAFGPPDRPPVAPLNLLGDFGAGGMLLALGVLAAVHEARASGHGQVVDAAIVDGTVSMLAMLSGLRAAGQWHERGHNQLDGSAANYTVYECADGHHIAVGALEPQFFQQFLRGLGLDPDDLPAPRRAARPLRADHRAQNPRRLGRRLQRQRRVRQPGPDRRRSGRRPPQHRPPDLAGDRRRAPARTRPALQQDPGRPAPLPPRHRASPRHLALGRTERLGRLSAAASPGTPLVVTAVGAVDRATAAPAAPGRRGAFSLPYRGRQGNHGRHRRAAARSSLSAPGMAVA